MADSAALQSGDQFVIAVTHMETSSHNARGLIPRVMFSTIFDIKLFHARVTICGYGEFY
jgi:hypothetical protein